MKALLQIIALTGTLAILSHNATAAPTVTVDTLADENDGVAAGGISLRDALADVDPGGTILFDASLSGGTIKLLHGALTFSKAALVDASNLAAGITIDAQRGSDVAHVTATATRAAEFRRITFTNGGGLGTGRGMVTSVSGGVLSLTLKDCDIAFNDDGGLHFGPGTSAQLSNCSVVCNRTNQSGAGIFTEGELIATNTTIAGNVSYGPPEFQVGSAIYSFGVSTSLSHCTVTANRTAGSAVYVFGAGGSLSAYHTIIAGNSNANIGVFMGGSVTSTGYNLFGDSTPSYAIASDILDTDPKLLPPMRRGGFTHTCAFRPDAPACDAGDPNIFLAPSTDQRGFARFKDGDGDFFGTNTIDIGAYELGETVTVTTDIDENFTFPDNGISLREAVSLAATTGDGTRITLSPNLPVVDPINFQAPGFELALGQIDLLSSLWIDASIFPMALPTIDAKDLSRIFRVTPGKTVTLEALGLENGEALDGGCAVVEGGAHLNLHDCEISDCDATVGDGGGILVANSGSAFVFRSALIGNSASADGGGIAVGTNGRLHLANTLFVYHLASDGGAIAAHDAGLLRIEHCTVFDNDASATAGGAFVGGSSVAEISYSVFAANTGGNHAGTIVSLGYNAEDSNLMFGGASTDITGIDPGPEFGSPVSGDGTLTGRQRTTYVLVQEGGQLLDAGETMAEYTGWLNTDQGGNPRARDGDADLTRRIDIGSWERFEHIIITTNADENDGPMAGAGVSLREAFDLANDDIDLELIEFDPALCGKEFKLSKALGGIELRSSSYVVGPASNARSIIVRGMGDSSTPLRIFRASGSISVVLGNMTLADGWASGDGGGILVENGAYASLAYCVITNCTATNGGAMASSPTGPSLAGVPGRGFVFAVASTLAGNHASSHGGAVYTGGSIDYLTSSTVEGNTAGGNGGALAVAAGNRIKAEYCTIANNCASGVGGGLFENGTAVGGEFIECILSRNLPTDVSGMATSTNSITTSAHPAFAAEDVVADAGLRSLGEYGGRCQTMALEPTSPAVDRGALDHNGDQRGFSKASSNWDLGAFELGDAITVDTTVDEENGIGVGAGTSLRDAIAASVKGTRIEFDPSLDGQVLQLGLSLPIFDNHAVHIDATSLPSGITFSDSNGDSRQILLQGYAELRGVRFTGKFQVFLLGAPQTTGVMPSFRAEGCLFDHVVGRTAINVGDCGITDVDRCTFEGHVGSNGPVILDGSWSDFEQCTFLNNSGGNAGGIDHRGSCLRIRYCTFSGNSSDLSYGDSITAFSGSIEFGRNVFDDSQRSLAATGATLRSLGYNVALGNQFWTAHPDDLLGTDPKLGLVDRSFGLTPVILPQLGSPLIDAAPAALVRKFPQTDQRGYRRPLDGDGDGTALADIGAVEARPVILVDTDVDENDGIAAGDVSLRDAISFMNTPANYIEPPVIAFAPHLDGALIQLLDFNGQLELTSGQEIDASPLTDGVTITGPGSGGAQFRVMDVNASGETVRLHCLTLQDGFSTSTGGGLRVQNGTTCVLSDCSVFDNFSGQLGGGIAVHSGAELLLERCTLAGNETDGFGGGLGVDAAIADARNCTISQNRANTSGGAIADLQLSDISLNHCTVADSSVGGGIDLAHASLRCSHTILVRNLPLNFSDRSGSGAIASLGFNLDDGNNGQFSDPSDLQNISDPRLDFLNNNGGRTLTHALLLGSPAIDVGDPGIIVSTTEFDQTGVRLRVQDGDYLAPDRIDIGSYELDLSTIPADYDNDCIPNGEEVAMGFDPTNATDGLADSDGDGVNNGKEWVAGTDHNDRDSLLELLSVQNISVDQTHFQVTWRSVVNPAITYDIYVSADLQVWTQAATGITASGTTTIGFANVAPPNQKRQFFEIRAVRP